MRVLRIHLGDVHVLLQHVDVFPQPHGPPLLAVELLPHAAAPDDGLELMDLVPHLVELLLPRFPLMMQLLAPRDQLLVLPELGGLELRRESNAEGHCGKNVRTSYKRASRRSASCSHLLDLGLGLPVDLPDLVLQLLGALLLLLLEQEHLVDLRGLIPVPLLEIRLVGRHLRVVKEEVLATNNASRRVLLIAS